MNNCGGNASGLISHNNDTESPSSCARPKTNCRGVALISAMLVVTLTAVIAVGMATRQQIDIRRTANVLDADRSYQVALGVESWAVGLLGRDLEDGKIDHLEEDWAKALPTTEVDGGKVAGSIEDLQGRFNLNNLLDEKGVSSIDMQRLQRLLKNLDIEPGLVQAILDWIDADVEPRFPNGAEEDSYLRQAPPYRNANAPFASISELRLVRGMEGEEYQRLAPFITALPERTDININTAPAAVLMALADNLTQTDAEALLESREEEAFRDIDSLMKHNSLAGLKASPEGLGVTSRYFRVYGQAQQGRGRTQLASMLYRPKGKRIRVVYRSLGNQ